MYKKTRVIRSSNTEENEEREEKEETEGESEESEEARQLEAEMGRQWGGHLRAWHW